MPPKKGTVESVMKHYAPRFTARKKVLLEGGKIVKAEGNPAGQRQPYAAPTGLSLPRKGTPRLPHGKGKSTTTIKNRSQTLGAEESQLPQKRTSSRAQTWYQERVLNRSK